MKTVLYLYSHRFTPWRRRLQGIFRHAAPNDWHVQAIDVSDFGSAVGREMDFWRADGLIVERGLVDFYRFPYRRFLDRPMVFCDVGPGEEPQGATCVQHDSRGTARRAVRALLDMHLASYGYIGFKDRRAWADEQEAAFRDELAHIGKSGSVYIPCRHRRTTTAMERYEQLKRWLAAFKLPCGVFAATDEMGAWVLLAARQMGLSVPGQLAVIAVGNDELICESTRPSLASISPDFEWAGEKAAELLGRRMDEPSLPPEMVVYGASSIVMRQSMKRLARGDNAVERALEFIRRNASAGVHAADVIAMMGLARRSAEMRFRRATGMSIQEAILAERVETAKALMRRPGLKLEAIAALSGWKTYSVFRRRFAAACGLPPSQWRTATRKGGIPGSSRPSQPSTTSPFF